MLIGVSGKFHSGKDTFTDYIVKLYGFKQLAFADPLKRGVAAFFGFSEEQVFGSLKDVKDEFWGLAPGKLLQIVGSDLFREALGDLLPEQFGNRDIWVRRAQREILNNPGINYILSDVRFPNEADFVRAMGGVTIRIERSEELRMKSAKASGVALRDPNHSSEIALDDYHNWDYVVDNNHALSHLYLVANNIIEGMQT